MKINFSSFSLPQSGVLVLLSTKEELLLPYGREIDQNHKGVLHKALDALDFQGGYKKVADIAAPFSSVKRVLVVGLGSHKELNSLKIQKIGAFLWSLLCKEKDVTVIADSAALNEDIFAAHLAYGFMLRSWAFNKYKTSKGDSSSSLSSATFSCCCSDAAASLFSRYESVCEGVFLSRYLVSEPGNAVYPKIFTEEVEKLRAQGLSVDILDSNDLSRIGAHLLLSVGQGSSHPPYLAVMRWNGASVDEPPIAFVGKGLTFDSGGICLKPRIGMGDMKFDMAGAAVVTGLMKSLASRKAAVNAVAIVALAENMPSGHASRPGDVVHSLSGKTVEIDNTDAEGRLVLADALCYLQKEFNPKLIIDLATLTGAVIVALGSKRAGLFSTDDTLADHLLQAGNDVGEPLWRLPVSEEYDCDIHSDIADIKNTGKPHGEAGSIAAAVFLKQFIDDVPWAHIDIAGTTWSRKGTDFSEKGATAFGVRLLDHYVEKYCESR